jgi:hypothetical protein
VVDLVNDVLRKRKYFNPQGWETFGEALREANVPQYLIGHEDRWKYITQTKRTPRSRKRQQSPSPIRPYSPKTHRETLTYVEVLSEMVMSYNHTVHKTIGIPPAEVTWANQTTVSKRLYGRKGPTKSCKFSPGDRVRLSKAKRTFKKGYLPNWTEELFTVVKCIETRPRYT